MTFINKMVLWSSAKAARHLWRLNAKHGASFPLAFLLIKLLFVSILAACLLFSEMPVHIFCYYFISQLGHAWE